MAIQTPPIPVKIQCGCGQKYAFDVQPTFAGRYAQNHYQVRGRLEATGNDPDSGCKPLRVLAP